MKNRIPLFLGCVVALSLAYTSVAETSFVPHGRISFDSGSLILKSVQSDQWSTATVNTLILPGDVLWVDKEGTAEVELTCSDFLRLADGSKVEILSLSPEIQVRGWMGSFAIQRLRGSQGRYQFMTPAAAVEVMKDSLVRVDIDEKGITTVSVRWGQAEVRSDTGGSTPVTESQRTWVIPGYPPTGPILFSRQEKDSFDEWINDRARLIAEGRRTIPQQITVTLIMLGIHDLHQYGEWFYFDGRFWWRPTLVVNYVPYRNGYWNYVPSIGHVWIDEYPFAYLTTHFGRWQYSQRYGWMWAFDSVWSPAWVAAVRVSDYYVWAPVDFNGRPVYVEGSATWTLGGVRFCVASASYVPAQHLYTGPMFIRPPDNRWIEDLTAGPPPPIHIWDIPKDPQWKPNVPFKPDQIADVNSFAPSQPIRGIPPDAGLALDPESRARELERALGRPSFLPERPPRKPDPMLVDPSQPLLPPPKPVHIGRREQMFFPRPDLDTAMPPKPGLLFPESQRLRRPPRPPLGQPKPNPPADMRPPMGNEGNLEDFAIRDLDSPAPAPPGSGLIDRPDPGMQRRERRPPPPGFPPPDNTGIRGQQPPQPPDRGNTQGPPQAGQQDRPSSGNPQRPSNDRQQPPQPPDRGNTQGPPQTGQQDRPSSGNPQRPSNDRQQPPQPPDRGNIQGPPQTGQQDRPSSGNPQRPSNDRQQPPQPPDRGNTPGTSPRGQQERPSWGDSQHYEVERQAPPLPPRRTTQPPPGRQERFLPDLQPPAVDRRQPPPLPRRGVPETSRPNTPGHPPSEGSPPQGRRMPPDRR